MKKNRKISFSALILCFLMLLSGCTRGERINVTELEHRLSAIDERLAFFDGEVFCNKQTYYTFLSFESERDILLTVYTDTFERVSRVTVTTQNNFAESFHDTYELVCRAVAVSMLKEDADVERLLSECGLYDASLCNDVGFGKSECGKYTLWVLRTSGAVSFSVDIQPFADNYVDGESVTEYPSFQKK